MGPKVGWRCWEKLCWHFSLPAVCPRLSVPSCLSLAFYPWLSVPNCLSPAACSFLFAGRPGIRWAAGSQRRPGGERRPGECAGKEWYALHHIAFTRIQPWSEAHQSPVLPEEPSSTALNYVTKL